jgi:hypothetical protein
MVRKISLVLFIVGTFLAALSFGGIIVGAPNPGLLALVSAFSGIAAVLFMAQVINDRPTS